MKQYINKLLLLWKTRASNPGRFNRLLGTIPSLFSSDDFAKSYIEKSIKKDEVIKPPSNNPLWEYFQRNKVGHGIWKWEHYFDIYHHHFSKFVGRQVDVLEIGIYSGGSLEMWRSYFGDKSHIYGIDIEEACMSYANENVSIFIGDQEDRLFWKDFRQKTNGVDIIIDDGGHTPEQQQITLEEMLPYLRPGGVYICEDIHGPFNRFSAFASGLVNELNTRNIVSGSLLQSSISQFQSSIHSIHFYPFMVVIEKHLIPPKVFRAPKNGSQWQPFL